jgi:hypothetical protein
MVRAAPFVAIIFNAVHAFAVAEFVVSTKAGSAAGTPSRALVVPRERVPTREAPAALVARMWPLSGVQFGVALQIVQSPEARLAGLTHIRLLLTVSQQMALEVMVSRKVRRAVRALVSLVGRRRLGTALAISG